MKTEFLKKCYPEFETELIQQIEEHSLLKTFQKGDFIIKQDQYIRYLPIIKKGCAKVLCNQDIKDFLLYFIESGETCIYSFAHLNNDQKANFSAVAETDTDLLLIPIDKVNFLIKKYPSLSGIVLNNYKKHYDDLLKTTKQLLSSNLEDRLIVYLKNKSKIAKSSILTISHKHIAEDLGTSREVISRVMKSKKLLTEVKQEGRQIKILNSNISH